MHPSRRSSSSHTLSGLGFGLLIFLGLGEPVVTAWTAFWFFVIAYALSVGGLLSSTLHLGHPERALKAFTQWQTSWLSREAWAAVAALLVMGLYAFLAVFFGLRVAALGWLGAALSLATVVATAMIYTQLRTVPRWNHMLTPLHMGRDVAGGGRRALWPGQITPRPRFLLLAARHDPGRALGRGRHTSFFRRGGHTAGLRHRPWRAGAPCAPSEPAA